MPQLRDYDSLFDNQKWEDRPEKDPVIVKREHDETKLDKKLDKSSHDNRKALAYVGWVAKLLVAAAVVAVVIFFIIQAFKYSFM